MTLAQEELEKRMEMIERIRCAFLSSFSTLPSRFRRGPIQTQLLEQFALSSTGVNRSIVSEALLELGYEKVIIEGTKYYRKKISTSS